MENNTNKNWSDLPVHKPDADLWDRIDTALDLQPVSANLDQLPQYSPNIGLWKSISFKLSVYQYIKYLYFAGATTITAVVLFLVFNNHSQLNKSENQNVDNLILNPEKISKFSTEKKPLPNKLIEVNKNNKEILNKESDFGKEKKNTTSDLVVKTANPVILKSKISVAEKIKNTDKMSETISKSDANILMQDVDNMANIVKPFKPEVDTELKTTKAAEIESTQAVEAKNKTTEHKSEKDEDIQGVEPRKVNMKSVNAFSKKTISKIGVDYSILKIYNKQSFSIAYTEILHQYGVNYQINYGAYLLQTGLSLSRFNDNMTTKADFQKDKLTKYNYVDSVIYNQQGEIIQYITHPVIFNDSVIYQDNVPVRKSYTLLNIPVLIGYQWCIAKFDIAIKSGLMCTMVISGKESIDLPVAADIKVLKTEAVKSSFYAVNWSAVVSSSVSYNFAKHWGISVEPIVYYYFKPMYDNKDIFPDYAKKSPYIFGLKSGLYYKF